nr:MAG TPA: hypothetical protein [Bacteriophage sp.]
MLIKLIIASSSPLYLIFTFINLSLIVAYFLIHYLLSK